MGVLLDKAPRLHKTLKVMTTFTLVCFSWIFFRSDGISDAFYIVTHLTDGLSQVFDSDALRYKVFTFEKMGFYKKELFIGFLSIGFMEAVHLVQTHGNIRHMLRKKPVYFRWATYYSMMLAIMFFGMFKHSPFIYFQF